MYRENGFMVRSREASRMCCDHALLSRPHWQVKVCTVWRSAYIRRQRKHWCLWISNLERGFSTFFKHRTPRTPLKNNHLVNPLLPPSLLNTHTLLGRSGRRVACSVPPKTFRVPFRVEVEDLESIVVFTERPCLCFGYGKLPAKCVVL